MMEAKLRNGLKKKVKTSPLLNQVNPSGLIKSTNTETVAKNISIAARKSISQDQPGLVLDNLYNGININIAGMNRIVIIAKTKFDKASINSTMLDHFFLILSPLSFLLTTYQPERPIIPDMRT